MTIKKFEEIEAWIEARILVKELYRLTKLQGFNKDWGVSQHIRIPLMSKHWGLFSGFISLVIVGILSVDTESGKSISFIKPFGLTALAPQRQALGLAAECVNGILFASQRYITLMSLY